MIRQNENIHGINILDEEILLSQFAEDTTFFPGWYKRIILLMYVLQQFASMSGLNINVDKTKAVWIGSRRN